MSRHLIHVGYPKSGSTFLQAWFGLHPELRYAPGGLGGFHNVYEVARPTRTEYKYFVTSFEGLSTPHESAGGVRLEFGGLAPSLPDPVKDNQRAVCEVLHGIFPESRVLIVTRGFKAMIASAYSQSVRAGGRLHPEAMCRELAARLRNEGQHYYDYDYLVGLYAEAFGEANLVVMPYELLRDDQPRFLSELERRLGLTHAEVSLGRVNESLSPEALYWYPLISRAVSAAASRLGNERARRVYTWYVGKTLEDRLRPLVRALGWLRPGRRVTADDFPEDVLTYCRGRATRLMRNPLYAPYAAEYLWGEVP
ncbi:MAG TPA: hypothetical protein VF521_05910 [Pyrinomonadaceae bacterium]|jgi:hypothetical protein